MIPVALQIELRQNMWSKIFLCKKHFDLDHSVFVSLSEEFFLIMYCIPSHMWGEKFTHFMRIEMIDWPKWVTIRKSSPDFVVVNINFHKDKQNLLWRHQDEAAA